MFKALLRTRVAELFSFFLRSGRKKSIGKAGGKILFVLLYVYIFFVFAIMIGSVFSTFGKSLFETEGEWIYYAMMILFELMIGVFASFSLTENQLYEAKDNELLLTMPIPALAILSSRLLMLLLWNFLTELTVVLPVAVIAFAYHSMSVTRLIGFIITALLLPVIVMVPSCLIAWVISCIKRRLGKSVIVSTILYLIFLGVYFYVYFNMNSFITELVKNSSVIGEKIKQIGFPIWLLGYGISSGNLLYVLAGGLFFLVLFAGVCLVLSLNFYKIATQRKKEVRRKYTEKEEKQSGVVQALMRKELKHLFSSAGYLINAGLGLIMMPVAAVIFSLKLNVTQSLFQNSSPDVIRVLNGNEILFVGVIVGACAMMVFISAPSISLEGKNLWIVKTIPVNSYKILMSKVLAHITASVPPLLLAFALTVILGKTNWVNIPFLLLMPFGTILFSSLFGVFAGLLLPKFDYVNEVAVVKQSGATLLSMMASFVMLGGFILFVVIVTVFSGSISLACYIGCTFYYLWSLLIWLWLKFFGTKRFSKLCN